MRAVLVVGRWSIFGIRLEDLVVNHQTKRRFYKLNTKMFARRVQRLRLGTDSTTYSGTCSRLFTPTTITTSTTSTTSTSSHHPHQHQHRHHLLCCSCPTTQQRSTFSTSQRSTSPMMTLVDESVMVPDNDVPSSTKDISNRIQDLLRQWWDGMSRSLEQLWDHSWLLAAPKQ